MGMTATVTIRNKKNGKTRIINQDEWAGDLGTARYSGWERVSEQHNNDESAKINIDIDKEAADAAAAKKLEEIAAREATEEAERIAKEKSEAETEATEDDDTVTTDEEAGDGEFSSGKTDAPLLDDA